MADESERPVTDKSVIQHARERLKRLIDDNQQERAKQKDDLLFSILEQWPAAVRHERENDPTGARPCLTIDQINQYIVQVVNDIRANRPAPKARPVDEQADVETAEVLQGVMRQIEDQSSAQVPYITAVESAVRVGEGYFRFVTDYENESSFNQAIRIKRVPDPFSVYLGPHVMPDGSDAEYGFVFEDLEIERFRRQWPKAKYQGTDFSELEDYKSYWTEEGKIRVAEYFYADYEPHELLFTGDGRSLLRSEYEELADKPAVSGTRQTRRRSIKWCKLTGLEILEKRDWAGKYVPIVKVIGKEAWVDGKHVCWGLVRPAKDALRMYNYVASTIVEKFALAPKIPFIGAKGQFENLEERWARANRVNYAYLEYNPLTVDGLAVPPPARVGPAPVEAALYQFLQTAREDVQASLAMFKASLGKEQPNQSGRAILALTRESDTGTFHFADNLGISIVHGGRIMIDLIPKIYDTARVIKIIGEDGRVSSAEINPDQPVAKREIRDGAKVRKIYNLGVGTYDVTVVVGPSFNTKRMEAAQLFTDLGNTAKDPVSGTVMRYLAVKNSDVPGADKAAEMLEKLLPPGLVKREGEAQVAPEVMAKMQQMGQALQVMSQENHELKSGVQQAQAKIAADHDAKMKGLALQAEVQAKELELETQKVQAEIALKQAIAVAEHDIDQRKMAAESQQQQDKLQFERQCRTEDEAHKVSVETTPKVLEMLESGLLKALADLTQVLAQNAELNRAAIEQIAKPKEVTLKKADGTTLKASVRTLNS